MTGRNVLRAITTRLTSIPVHELPQHVGYLATSLTTCGELSRTSSPTNEQSVLLHKLRIRVSALLQDRTSEGRFSGIVIAKALVETGSAALLSELGSWVRNLISCLNKPDSPEIKRLCIITISRIYLLTVGDQALVREIASPTLPAFISTSLGLVKPLTAQIDGRSIRALSPLMEVVLRSWHLLIEHFASTFRPSTSSFKSICLSLISDSSCPREIDSLAHEVLARLHFCAPKNNVAADWTQICSQVIEAAHDTADLVFRAINEDWSPAAPRTSKVARKQKAASTPATSNSDVLGLDPWSGISQGCSRLVQYVDILRHLLTAQHAQEIHVPIGAIFDLTSRLTAVSPPTAKFSLRTNNEVTRDEREELWLNVSRLHSVVLQLFQSLAETFESNLFPVCNAIATQFWDVFEAESDDEIIRLVSYKLVASLLRCRLLPLSKSDSACFKRLVHHCCRDLSVQDGHLDERPSLQHNALSKQQSQSKVSTCPTLYDSAYALLPTILTYAPLRKLTGYSSIRIQLDQTAILLEHHEAILASVLNPSRPRPDAKTSRIANPAPSLIPFLARFAEVTTNENHRLALDALLRPRMPVNRSTNEDLSAIDHDRDEEEDEDEEHMDENDGNLQPGKNLDIAMADTVSSRHTSTQAPPSLQDPLGAANGQKRDFTTLLEQRMDAQLAASDSKNMPTVDGADQDGVNRECVTKRPRTSEEPVLEHTSIATAEDQSQELASRRPSVAAASEADKPFVATANDLSDDVLLQDSASRNTYKSEDKTTYDLDDSSDSEVPPIDATLNGMSDSEDEVDE